MRKYSKFWTAIVGTAGVALSSFGVIGEAESQSVVTSVISLLAAFGVYQIPNR